METGARQAPGAFTVVVKKSILGAKVINTDQEDLGKIEDLVIDARNSRVAYAILSFGGVLGLGDKHFAIPWEALTFRSVAEGGGAGYGKGSPEECAGI